MGEKNWNLREIGYTFVTNLNGFLCDMFSEMPGVSVIAFGMLSVALLFIKQFNILSFLIGGAFVLCLANYLSIEAEEIEKRRDVGLTIQILMKEKGISETKLAELMKTSIKQVRRYEFGQIKYDKLTYNQKRFLGKLLNLSPDFFSMNPNNLFYDMTYEEYEACMKSSEEE